MSNELITTVSSVTTGVKNIFDITTNMITNRAKNKLITQAELQYLKVTVQRTIELARGDARHRLSEHFLDNLQDTYQRIEDCDPNSMYGQIVFEMLRSEAASYFRYIEDFDLLTQQGFF